MITAANGKSTETGIVGLVINIFASSHPKIKLNKNCHDLFSFLTNIAACATHDDSFLERREKRTTIKWLCESCRWMPNVVVVVAPLTNSFVLSYNQHQQRPGTISTAINSFFFAICFFLFLIDFPYNVSECEAREIFLVGNLFFLLVILNFSVDGEEEKPAKIIDAMNYKRAIRSATIVHHSSVYDVNS